MIGSMDEVVGSADKMIGSMDEVVGIMDEVEVGHSINLKKRIQGQQEYLVDPRTRYFSTWYLFI